MKMVNSFAAAHGTFDRGLIPYDGVRLCQIKREIEAQIVRALMKRTEHNDSQNSEATREEI